MLDVDDDDRFLNAVEHDLVQAPDTAVGDVVFMGKFAGTVDVSDRQRGNHSDEIGAGYDDEGIGDGFCIQNHGYILILLSARALNISRMDA